MFSFLSAQKKKKLFSISECNLPRTCVPHDKRQRLNEPWRSETLLGVDAPRAGGEHEI